MLKNLKMVWKLAIITAFIPLTVILLGGTALLQMQNLLTQYNTLYDFMLIPISNLDHGNLSRANLAAELYVLTTSNFNATDRAGLVEMIRQDDEKMVSIIARYEKEWITSASPDFMATLKKQGQLDLQKQESSALQAFHTAYTSYAGKREKLLSGESKDYALIQADLTAMEQAYTDLIAVNDQFAQLIQNTPKELVVQSQWTMVIIGLVAVVIAGFIAVLISRDITVALQKMVAMVRETGLGHLSGRLNMKRRDEIGEVGQILDKLCEDLQVVVVGTMTRIAEGDLTVTFTPKDAQDELGPAMAQTIALLNGMLAEINRLIEAAREGKVYMRGNPEAFRGGYRVLIEGINNLLDLFANPLALISDASTNLNSATAEILAAVTQQASGANEQSAAISQTSTSIEEIKAITDQSLLRIKEVEESARRTQQISVSGLQAVETTIESMQDIRSQVEGIAENILALSEQTQQIGEIITTVNEIASQSNMLALNASVEAARAGEHGKGFAVVAQEVRSLAEQSRSATAQVKTILSEIQKATNATVMATEEGSKGVEVGVKRAEEARKAIEQLSQAINASAQISVQLSAGGQQQKSGMEQVTMAMQNIHQATVQGLASTHQTEQSAGNLNDLSHRMMDTIRKYKLN